MTIVAFTPKESGLDEPQLLQPHTYSPAPPQQDGSNLKTCLDLLTSELSSALGDRANRDGRGPAALQVWVTIQAYERLQDNVATMSLSERERHTLGTMFNSWLAALYSVHESLSPKTAELETL